MLDFTQCDWIDLTKLTRYHQNLMSFLSENYLNKSGGTINGQINSCSILPKSPSSYNLGSSTNQWSNIYSNGFVLVDSTGQIRPNSTGTGNIGTSSYYWGNAYINNITSGNIVPKTDNTYDIGSSSYKFKDGYFNGWLYATHFISANGNVRPSVNGQGSIGTSSYYWSAGYINSLTTGSIISKTDNTYDLGSSSKRWKNIYVNSLNTNNITAQTDNTYDLGSTSYYWKDAYINNIYGIAIYQNGNQVWDKSNLQVGGRNLLKNSNVNYSRSITMNHAMFTLYYGNYKPNTGDTVTVSIKLPNCDWDNYVGSILLNFDFPNYEYKYITKARLIANDIYAITFEFLETSSTGVTFQVNRINTGTAYTIVVDWVKLEYGNQVTTWTPAPEDVDADISTAQTTANTAVSNAATAQSGVNTLNEIVMPNGEILSYNADNYLDNTSSFKDEVQKFDNANLTANTYLDLFGYDDKVGRFVKIRQDATNNTYIRFLYDYSSNAGLSNAINSSMLTAGYSLWLKCKIYDSAVSTDSETHGGLFTLKSYGMMGIGIRKQTKYFTLCPYGTTKDTSIAIDFEKWIDVCLTVEGSNTETKKAKLYVNGALKAEQTWSGTQRNGFDVIYLTQGGGAHNSTHISMDVKAIKVFLRPLTAGEVAGLTKYFNTTGSATAKNINNAQSTADNAVTNLNNINLMTTASVDALFNLTSATNALESVQTMDSDDITDILHDR